MAMIINAVSSSTDMMPKSSLLKCRPNVITSCPLPFYWVHNIIGLCIASKSVSQAFSNQDALKWLVSSLLTVPGLPSLVKGTEQLEDS